MEAKTIREWFNTLPEPYRSQAFKNTNLGDHGLDNDPVTTLYTALFRAFVFRHTPEGYEYWNALLCNSEKPMLKKTEAKTIRFKKGERYTITDLIDVPFELQYENFDFDGTDSHPYTAKKSFTVQINIIEDGE